MSIQVKDADGVGKYIETASGDGSSGTPFISSAGVNIGAKADSAASTDTGTFSLISLTKRLIQRITSLIALVPAALTGSGNFKVSLEESNATIGISSLADTNATFTTGRKSSITTSAVQITTTSVVASKGVSVKAAIDNTGRIYAGLVTVTNDTTDATDGYELGPGESILIPVNNANKVYCIGSTSGQKIFWLAT